MKIWKLQVIVEAEDSFTEKDIFRRIDRDANRGDGIYIAVNGERRYKKDTEIKFVKHESDE